MRELTNFEKQLLINLKHDLMDSDGHNKTDLRAECLSEIEAIRIINEELTEGKE